MLHHELGELKRNGKNHPIHERAHNLGITSVTKEGVMIAAEKARNIMRGVQGEALRDIFGSELDLLQQPGASEHATNLFTPLLNDIFDKGNNRDVRCEVEVVEQPPNPREKPYIKQYKMYEKAASVYTRSSFISRILHKEEAFDNGHISMGRVDLERFRDADFDVGNKKGIRPADVMINTTAITLREALEEVWKEEDIDRSSNFYDVGRYGGDELIFSLVGTQAQKHKNKVMDILVAKLSDKYGFYKNANGEIERSPIKLKKGPKDIQPVEWIEFSGNRSNEEKIMYKEYLQRGLILSESDFEREKGKYTSDDTFNFAAYRKDYPVARSIVSYPDNIVGSEAKITYISTHYPEFALYFGLAEVFDREDNSDTTHVKRQEKLLTIVENLIFDKLLGDMIYSKIHFMKHMDRKEMRGIYMCDFKKLKEINTAMTYADADNAIKRLWGKVKESVSEDERHKIMVGRSGGAFYVGVRKGETLSIASQDKLNRITRVPFDEQNTYTVPVGHAYINLEDPKNEKLDSSAILNTLEKASDKAYYQGLVEDVQGELQQNSNFMVQVASVNLEDLAKRAYKPLSKPELYALHLRGKRKSARMKALIDALDPLDKIQEHLQDIIHRAP